MSAPGTPGGRNVELDAKSAGIVKTIADARHEGPGAAIAGSLGLLHALVRRKQQGPSVAIVVETDGKRAQVPVRHVAGGRSSRGSCRPCLDLRYYRVHLDSIRG